MNGGLVFIKSNSLPERKEDTEEIEQEISAGLQEITMKHFSSGNPNPVLRIDRKGRVLYANRAADFLLEHWGIKEGEEIPQTLLKDMKRILFQQNPENLEINTGKVTYSLVLKDCPEDGCMDIYGFDISYRVQAEEELRNRYKRLEELIGLKSAECMEVNERLAKEVIERQRVEHIFRNNLRFLETLLDSIPSPVFQRDLNEVYVNCNESFARQIMGLPKEAVIGGSFSEFQKKVPKELADIYYKHDRELLQNGGSNYYETRVICADGRTRDFLFHKAAYRDGAGEVAGIAGIMLDITPRKEAERFLRKTEEKYRLASEQTGQLVYDYEIEPDIIHWAGAISQITGYSPEEFMQVGLEGWIGHVHPEDRKRVWEVHEKCMKNGGKFLEDYRFRKKDGSYFYAEDSGVYIQDDFHRACRIVGVIKDITESKLARESLERSEQRFRMITEQTGQLVYDYDVQNNSNYWVGAIEELTGYSFEEFQGFTPEVWSQHVHPEDREKAVKAHFECIKNGGKFCEEYRFRIKDGTYIYVEDSGIYLKTGDQGIYRVLGVMKDITEKRLSRQKLQESEERFRIAAEQTGQIVFEHDHGDRYIKWVGAIQDVTGYTVEEFIKFDNAAWANHIHPEDRDRTLAELKKFQENENKFRTEYRFRKKDGSYIHLEDSGIYLRNEDGNIRKAFGVMKDITEIKMASEKLKESEERYRLFMKNFRGIAFQMDIDFTPILVDGNVEEITGYRMEDLSLGKIDWYRIVHPDDRVKLFENREGLVKDPFLFIEHDYRIMHKGGEIKWVHEIFQNVFDSMGKKRILQGAAYDISRQKEAEESLAKIEEFRKKEIHHRIKNNLQVISSLLELQAEKFKDINVLEAFRESQNRVSTMAIIHEELYRSKNNEALDFSAYLQKLTEELFQTYVVRKGDVDMQLDIEEIFLGMDTAVPLGIIINELISNSLKHAFLPGMQGKISIKLSRTEENEGNKSISNITNNIGAKSSIERNFQYTLVVSDNGLGFPENIDFRSTNSLGLQLVNILVEQLEGRIELENDSGTKFKIWFKDPYHSSENLSSTKGEI